MNKQKNRTLSARGGAWSSDPVFLRSTNRIRFQPEYRNDFLGFRILKEEKHT